MRQCFTLPSLTQVWVYTRAEAEHVRYPTWGDALRGAETRPVTSDTLGVRVVGAASGLPRRRGGRLGRGTQRARFAIDPMCAP